MMRHQLLAREMEEARELGAEVVTVVHISPANNTDLRWITSPGLSSLGDSVAEAWKSLLRTPGRFIEVHTEDLLDAFDISAFPVLTGWHHYIGSRYPFSKE